MNKKYFWIILLIIIAGIFFGFSYKKVFKKTATTNTSAPASTPAPTSTPTPTTSQSQYALPVANFSSGQTKKVFGQYITPATSPVQPEKFTGYHTGVDIEQEQNDIDVPVYAINDGTVKFSGRVGGYGGVIIYETTINNETVTILYGHTRLSSAEKKVGDTVSKGEKLAVLGTGYSNETDGERKHLHFSIHKGSQIEYRGYVKNESELLNWINPGDIIK